MDILDFAIFITVAVGAILGPQTVHLNGYNGACNTSIRLSLDSCLQIGHNKVILNKPSAIAIFFSYLWSTRFFSHCNSVYIRPNACEDWGPTDYNKYRGMLGARRGMYRASWSSTPSPAFSALVLPMDLNGCEREKSATRNPSSL